MLDTFEMPETRKSSRKRKNETSKEANSLDVMKQEILADLEQKLEKMLEQRLEGQQNKRSKPAQAAESRLVMASSSSSSSGRNPEKS